MESGRDMTSRKASQNAHLQHAGGLFGCFISGGLTGAYRSPGSVSALQRPVSFQSLLSRLCYRPVPLWPSGSFCPVLPAGGRL